MNLTSTTNEEYKFQFQMVRFNVVAKGELDIKIKFHFQMVRLKRGRFTLTDCEID